MSVAGNQDLRFVNFLTKVDELEKQVDSLSKPTGEAALQDFNRILNTTREAITTLRSLLTPQGWRDDKGKPDPNPFSLWRLASGFKNKLQNQLKNTVKRGFLKSSVDMTISDIHSLKLIETLKNFLANNPIPLPQSVLYQTKVPGFGKTPEQLANTIFVGEVITQLDSIAKSYKPEVKEATVVPEAKQPATSDSTTTALTQLQAAEMPSIKHEILKLLDSSKLQQAVENIKANPDVQNSEAVKTELYKDTMKLEIVVKQLSEYKNVLVHEKELAQQQIVQPKVEPVAESKWMSIASQAANAGKVVVSSVSYLVSPLVNLCRRRTPDPIETQPVTTVEQSNTAVKQRIAEIDGEISTVDGLIQQNNILLNQAREINSQFAKQKINEAIGMLEPYLKTKEGFVGQLKDWLFNTFGWCKNHVNKTVVVQKLIIDLKELAKQDNVQLDKLKATLKANPIGTTKLDPLFSLADKIPEKITEQVAVAIPTFVY